MSTYIIIAIIGVVIGAIIWFLWTKIRKYAFFIMLAALVAGIFVLIIAFKRVNKSVQVEMLSQSFAQFVELKGTEELVIAQLTTRETLNKQSFTQLKGITLGESSGEFSAVAHYKFYTQLSQLHLDLCGRDLSMKAPDLDLSLPVAYESQTVSATAKREWLGMTKAKMLDSLQNEFSSHLAEKGRLSRLSVYPVAAESLAEIIHQFLLNNAQYVEYENVRVQLGVREYIFAKARHLCGVSPCNWEIRLPGDRVGVR